jgi:pantothenate kinase type III
VTLLAADMGNTSLTIGLFGGDWPARRATTRRRHPDEAPRCVTCSGSTPIAEELTAVGRSVVPPLTGFERSRTRLLEPWWSMRPAEGILPIEIDRPAEAGADRYAMRWRPGSGGPAIVTDLGTSTNFGVITLRGSSAPSLPAWASR